MEYIKADEIERPVVRVVDTGKEYTVNEVNFGGRYVTFFIDEETSWAYKDQKGVDRITTRLPGEICLRYFDDIEFCG